jgi:hypothetical protein
MLPRIVIVFFLNNQPDALIIPILSCYKTLCVSGILSVQHQEFSTLALVSFMQVFDDRFQAESGCLITEKIGIISVSGWLFINKTLSIVAPNRQLTFQEYQPRYNT